MKAKRFVGGLQMTVTAAATEPKVYTAPCIASLKGEQVQLSCDRNAND
jgi:hypothetical protein